MIPEWFDHISKGNTLCFWFQKELPSIAVCAVLGVLDNIDRPFHVNFNFYLKINDIEIPFLFDFNYILETDHIFMINYFIHSMDVDTQCLISDNWWNEAEILFVIPPDSVCSGTIKWTGVYVNQKFTRMEDVRFENPNANRHANPQEQPRLNRFDFMAPVMLLNRFDFMALFMLPFWDQTSDDVYSNFIPGESSQSLLDTRINDAIESLANVHDKLFPGESSQTPRNMNMRYEDDLFLYSTWTFDIINNQGKFSFGPSSLPICSVLPYGYFASSNINSY